MRRRSITVARFLGMPRWLADSMSAIGVSAVIYMLVRYTFLGELLEDVYRRAFGYSPVEELQDDVQAAGTAIRNDLRRTARELDGQ